MIPLPGAVCPAMVTYSSLQVSRFFRSMLAVGAQGRELLRAIDARTSVPVITKPAAGRSLPGEAGEIFALTADAHDLYVLGCPAREERRCGGDWRASPFVL